MDSRLGKMLSSRPESVTIPTKARALEILQHSSVCVPWGFYVDDIGNMDGLVLLDDKVLVQLIPRGRKLEIHGCCKLRDRAKMGEPFAKLLEWIAQHGWAQIYTTAPDDRVALFTPELNGDAPRKMRHHCIITHNTNDNSLILLVIILRNPALTSAG